MRNTLGRPGAQRFGGSDPGALLGIRRASKSMAKTYATGFGVCRSNRLPGAALLPGQVRHSRPIGNSRKRSHDHERARSLRPSGIGHRGKVAPKAAASRQPSESGLPRSAAVSWTSTSAIGGLVL